MRRYPDGGYYEEDYAPYDRENWALLLDLIEWMELVERPEIVDGLVVAWISSGRLPIASWSLHFNTGEASVRYWAGPPPGAKVLYDHIQDFRDQKRQSSIPVRKAIPYRRGDPVSETMQLGEQVGIHFIMAHCATLGELARDAGLLTPDMEAEAETLVERRPSSGEAKIRAELRRLFPGKTRKQILDEEGERLGRKAHYSDIAARIDAKVWDEAGDKQTARDKMVSRALPKGDDTL